MLEKKKNLHLNPEFWISVFKSGFQPCLATDISLFCEEQETQKKKLKMGHTDKKEEEEFNCFI